METLSKMKYSRTDPAGAWNRLPADSDCLLFQLLFRWSMLF